MNIYKFNIHYYSIWKTYYIKFIKEINMEILDLLTLNFDITELTAYN